MSEAQYNYYEFVSPVLLDTISERADGKVAIVRGVTLKGDMTRNRNLYAPRVKRSVAKGMVGQPILFGAPRDHINPPKPHDIVTALHEFKLLAAKFIVGHITEAIYDESADLIRWAGEIRNTIEAPDIVDRVQARDIRYTSIGGLGQRAPTITPRYGPVNEVISIMVTHMSFVAIPGDPDSEITQIIIKESFDLNELEEVLENMSGNPDEGGQQAGGQEGGAGDAGGQQGGTPQQGQQGGQQGDQGGAGGQQPSGPTAEEVYKGLLKQIEDIRKQRDELANKLGLSEQERKKLEDEAARTVDVPTKEDLELLEQKIGDFDKMRSDLDKYTQERKRDLERKHLALVDDVVGLLKFENDDAKNAKIEELKTLEDSSLITLRDNLKAEKQKIDDELKEIQKRTARGAITLTGPKSTPSMGPYDDFAEQYKKLSIAERQKLWELWRVSVLSRV